jgi:F-type H+-transporting ATPase subunit b
MEQVVGIFGIDARLLVIQMVNFLILLVLLHRFLYKPLVGMMEKRRLEIEKGLDDAKQAGIEREKAGAYREEAVMQAKADAKEIVNKAIEGGEKMKEGIVHDADEKAKEIIAAAERWVGEEKDRITEKAKKEVGELTVRAVENMLREKIDPAAEKAFINRSLGENT